MDGWSGGSAVTGARGRRGMAVQRDWLEAMCTRASNRGSKRRTSKKTEGEPGSEALLLLDKAELRSVSVEEDVGLNGGHGEIG
jgi:hypothetical protein